MASQDSCCLALRKPLVEVYQMGELPQSLDNPADSGLTPSQPNIQTPHSAPTQFLPFFYYILCLGFPSCKSGSPELLI